MLAHAVQHESARTQAILAVLFGTACRVSSLLGVQLEQLTHQGRFRVLRLPVKGGRTHTVKVSSYVGELLDGYLAERGTTPGAIFLSRTGIGLQADYIRELVQRIAKAAGVPDPGGLPIHGIRHSVAPPCWTPARTSPWSKPRWGMPARRPPRSTPTPTPSTSPPPTRSTNAWPLLWNAEPGTS